MHEIFEIYPKCYSEDIKRRKASVGGLLILTGQLDQQDSSLCSRRFTRLCSVCNLKDLTRH